MEEKGCIVDLSALRLLSYQGIMAAFNQLIIGSSTLRERRGSLEANTSVMDTVLAETEELAFLWDWKPHNFQPLSPEAYQGLSGERVLGTRGALKSTLEELFQNLTISLLAEPYFQ